MIYKTRREALEASKEFNELLNELEEKFGATFWENDDCAGSGWSFSYYDEDGKVKQTYE